MRVLLAHTFYRSSAPSGEDAVYKDERRLLEENGVDVVPFEKYNDDLDDSSTKKRIQVALNTSWSTQSYRDITNLIRITRPDVAHFHNTFPQISPSAYHACLDNNVPVVQTLHNFRFICPGAMLLREGKPCELCISSSLLNSLRYRCYRGSLAATSALALTITRNRLNGSYDKMVNRYIALTEFAKSRAIAGGLPSARIVVKPNFINIVDKLSTVPAKSDYVVFVGRLKAEKGVRTLLSAWRQLGNIPLLILGDGELRPELERYSQENHLNVTFLGYQPREAILDYVARAKCQIIPSEWYEGFPLVVLEAYACGTPVIASRIGSLDELIEDGITGMKFTPGDENDLVRAVKLLISDNASLLVMGDKARRICQARYSSQGNFHRLMAIYEEARADFGASRNI